MPKVGTKWKLSYQINVFLFSTVLAKVYAISFFLENAFFYFYVEKDIIFPSEHLI